MPEKKALIKRFKEIAMEVTMIVVGILLAMAIDDWNDDRHDDEDLKSYLSSIAENIKSDIRKAEFINNIRLKEISQGNYIQDRIIQKTYFDIPDINVASEVLASIMEPDYLNADLSGYESLKSSGFLAKLQGKELQNLLYRYYNLVKEITVHEANQNARFQNAGDEFAKANFQNLALFFDTDYLVANRKLLNDLQSYFEEIINHPVSQQLYRLGSDQEIVRNDNLIVLGNEIIRMIGKHQLDFDEASHHNLSAYFDIIDSVGYPKIMERGMYNAKFFIGGSADANNNLLWEDVGLDEYTMDYPANMAWGFHYFVHRHNHTELKVAKDYSMYKTLELELKGVKGGELVEIVIKDIADPEDDSATKVPLTLTNDWKTYNIPLSEFKTADLKNLHIVVGFKFEGGAKSIRVRKVEYLR
ncbi:MAG: hypothetical protein Roseis2KO_52950 [Roseivirga sp.]